MGKSKDIQQGSQLEAILEELELVREWWNTDLFESLSKRNRTAVVLTKYHIYSKRLATALMKERSGWVKMLGDATFERLSNQLEPIDVYGGFSQEDLDSWMQEEDFDPYAGMRDAAQKNTQEVAYLLELGPTPDHWK
jgi:hypothetical protein